MNKFITISAAFLFLIGSSCSSNETVEEKPSVPEIVNLDFTKTFKGTIDNQYDITMTLDRKDKELTGSYSYKSQGIAIDISGSIDDDGSLTLNEFNDLGSMTGIFHGELAEGEINGQWSKPDGSKTMSFTLSEFEKSADDGTMSKKKELLTSLIGEHKLHSISGSMGANTMVEYYLEGRIWNANGSSIEYNDEEDGPMREGYIIDLDSDDLRKLNSMKIVVLPDLTVSVVCNGKTHISTPFKENGMDYKLNQNPSEYGMLPEKLTKKTTFIRDDLYLFAKSYPSSSSLEEIDIVFVDADVAILSYSKESGFSLGLIFGDCCDNSWYGFK